MADAYHYTPPGGPMPWSPRHPCAHPRCPNLVPTRQALCDNHTGTRELRPCAQPDCPTLTTTTHCPAHTIGFSPQWHYIRRAILERNPTCQHCGTRAATDVDHIIARQAGGTDNPSNLQALCHRCHSRKTARHDGSFGRPRRPPRQ